MIDKLLKAKIDDGIRLCKKGPKFIGFLDTTETSDAMEYIKWNRDAQIVFFGGFEESERVVMGIFPDYLEPDEEYFPVIPITFSYKKEYKLTHRDFLGSLMAQGITRTTVGDILIEDGRSVVFVKEEISDYVLQNIFKIGKIGVSLTKGIVGELPNTHSFEEVGGVVASTRLDCVVALLAGTSRDKSATMINTGNVFINRKEVTNVSYSLSESEILTIRYKGKFILDSLGSKTKKGRTIIKCRKYK